ncbi:flagellar biosynthetic protein FliO [Magnetospirillum sulfuroxidans]|uniref:Flagellar biosynthetic protein FliO n=1 Tax=Magnetospirillum sulfuroxidans TaxID=611300 RepID=A0ABS5IFY4_9PROT|nr:flagellar biosynthetic protein FliO [Magnetospirillum sulfuroxidans]MBR9973171.1 flagellar biosynthetic protein FliO [Magnetospirillum sulfuroxidans]
MDMANYIRTVAALVLVLGMIVGVLWLLRRFGVPGMVPRQPGNRRLGVIETIAVDSRRRLVLVRRDGREHLLLLGAAGDVVIEANIDAAPGGPMQGEGN